ncbi:unnamed protein product [Rhizophagus irregularis]|nr:unnamed protein product [Rhizophagus irregularis]
MFNYSSFLLAIKFISLHIPLPFFSPFSCHVSPSPSLPTSLSLDLPPHHHSHSPLVWQLLLHLEKSGSVTPRFRNGKMFQCSRIPKRKMFQCSRIPKRKMFRYSRSTCENAKKNVQVLQDSKTEKCLQVGCHWKVKMIRAGYLTLINFWSLIDLELPPSSFRSLGFG